MARFIKRTDAKVGLPPGSLVFVGERSMDAPRIRCLRYASSRTLEEFEPEAGGLTSCPTDDGVVWLNIDGLHDEELMARIGEIFGLPALIMEDVLNTTQRPRLEEFENGLFICLKMFVSDKEQGSGDDQDVIRLHARQLSMVLGPGYLLTFQERVGDVFEPVRRRLRSGRGSIRGRGADYLAYALLDCVFENYALVMEEMGDAIEELDEAVLDDPGPDVLERIVRLKRELAYLARALRPAREMAVRLPRLESDLLSREPRDGVLPYLRDLRDLAEQTGEALDTYKEVLSGQFNIYNTMVANRLSDVMRFLTIFSTIFIPLTFVAGVYGTNFKYLPELEWKYGYFALWGVMLFLALGMIFFFRRKKWL